MQESSQVIVTPLLPHKGKKHGYDVGMFDPVSDEDDIHRARSRYNARKTDSPLIAWICSPEWDNPAATWYPDQTTRGLIHESGAKSEWRYGSATYGANVAHGEIDVPCHPHCRSK